LTIVLAGATGAAAFPAEAPSSATIAEARTSIPPNCTLNPWTHKYVCHKWPKPKKK
jgi:hypothetical protein